MACDRRAVAALVLALTVTACAEAPAATLSPATAAGAGAVGPSAEVDAAPDLTESPPPPEPLVEIDLQANVDAATAYAQSHGLTVGIAVLDRQTGELASNGAAAVEPVWTASVAKLFIADNLLHRDRTGELTLTAADRELMDRMLEFSDDAAADTLYYGHGTESMITEVADRYGLPGIIASNDPGEWELTSATAQAVVRYYDRFLDVTPAADRDYVVGQLRRIQHTAADGFDQLFGIPAALPGGTWGVKQGWMCCPRDTSYLHTTGILGADDRYAVAILSQRPAEGVGYSTDTLTGIAQRVLPPAEFG